MTKLSTKLIKRAIQTEIARLDREAAKHVKTYGPGNIIVRELQKDVNEYQTYLNTTPDDDTPLESAIKDKK